MRFGPPETVSSPQRDFTKQPYAAMPPPASQPSSFRTTFLLRFFGGGWQAGIQPFLGYLWANKKYNTQHLVRLFLLFLFILIVHRATKILLRVILRTFPRGWEFDIHIRIIVLSCTKAQNFRIPAYCECTLKSGRGTQWVKLGCTQGDF